VPKGLVNLALAFDDTGRVSFLLLTPLSPLPATEIEHRASQVATAFFQEKFNDVYSGFDEALNSRPIGCNSCLARLRTRSDISITSCARPRTRISISSTCSVNSREAKPPSV
jgi:hypothetical protein